MDPNQYIWDNFHSLPRQGGTGEYGSASKYGGPSQNEFLNMLKYYGINTNNPQELEEKLRKIIEIQKKSAWQTSSDAYDGHSSRANSLENYLNYIMRGMQFPAGGATLPPDVNR